MMKLIWKRRVFGPDEVIHARKARGSMTKVCEVSAFLFDGYVAKTIRKNARHWFGEDITAITCKECKARLFVSPQQRRDDLAKARDDVFKEYEEVEGLALLEDLEMYKS